MWELFRLFAFYTMENEAFECELKLKFLHTPEFELMPS